MKIEIERSEEFIAVHGDFKVLSSAVYNGGFVKAKTIINLNVSRDFSGDAFEVFDSFFEERAEELGLAEERGLEQREKQREKQREEQRKEQREKQREVVGVMTAVPMKNAKIVEAEREPVTAIITAGISKPTEPSSTVNIILLVSKNLSQSAMANLLIVATEAKTAAFADLNVRDENSDLFTGDATDSVVVACTACSGEGAEGEEEGKEEAGKEEEEKEEEEKEEEERFAGKATRLGKAVYEVVREGVKEALFLHNRLSVERPILTRLEERGIFLAEMVAAGLELYVAAEGEEEVGKEELKARLEAAIKRECSDVNVALLLAAALHSEEEDVRKGRAGEAGAEDAACIVADELIGIDIAEYIGGKKALF
ncbi:MAG: adenosylcobinamide amidohydrolase, partial [Candidatus Methanospirareceae archaeon]